MAKEATLQVVKTEDGYGARMAPNVLVTGFATRTEAGHCIACYLAQLVAVNNAHAMQRLKALLDAATPGKVS